MCGVGLVDLAEMGMNLVEGHAPGQAFNASLNGLDSPKKGQRCHQADQCCLQSFQHHSLVLLPILPRRVPMGLKKNLEETECMCLLLGRSGHAFESLIATLEP